MEMDSHEEKRQDIIAQNKEQEAKAELKRKAKQFKKQRKEASKRGQGFMQGNYSTDHSVGGLYSPSPEVTPAIVEQSHSPLSTPSTSHVKGMKLGRKSKSAALSEALQTETEGQAVRPSRDNIDSNSKGIHVASEERISLVANADGDLEQLDIKGALMLRIADSSNARIRIMLQVVDDPSIQFKTHPNVDKSAFKAQNVVQMRDLTRPFPVNQNLEVVRWRVTTKDETLVPLSVNCWSSSGGDGSTDVNVEYNLEAEHLELRDVTISIPVPVNHDIQINQVVDGFYVIDSDRQILEWQIPLVSTSNKSGSLEFSLPGSSKNECFPISVSFVSDKLICDLDVLDVVDLENNNLSISFSKEIVLVADGYTVG
ncbi:Coatomer subunit delta [Apophysomyces sp. BC1034]|nr:Coatomer subunit delta [Apophysomyces sp. BC1034]